MILRRVRAACFCTIVGLLATTPLTAAPHSTLDKFLVNAARESSGTERVIVRLAGDDGGRVRTKIRRHGDRIEAEHPVIHAFTARVHRADLEALAADPAIASISIDAAVRPDAVKKGQISLASSDLLRATLNLTNSTLTGNFIGVGVIDSGIEPSRDFSGRIVVQYDFVNGSGVATAPGDEYGHGTHVAGLIGSGGVLSYDQFMGVAPKVRFISMRVLDRTGTGQTSAVIQAIEECIRQKNTLGIDVLNLSLGHPIYESAASDPLVQAVEAAVRAGIVVVASAGNHGADPATSEVGYAGITSPGNAPSAITAGALKSKGTVVRSDDEVAAYSSRGPTWYDAVAKPDVVAPGHREISDAAVNSALWQDNPDLHIYSASGSPFLTLSGTSMATGVTTGVVALMLEASRNAALTRYGPLPSFSTTADFYTWCSGVPHLTPNEVKAILQFTAIRMKDAYGGAYDTLTQGAGSINAEAAALVAGLVDPRVALNAWWLPSGVNTFSAIAAETFAWSHNIIWSDSVIFGDSAFYNLTMWAWGQNIIWGDQSAWGSSIIWGDLKPLTLLVSGTNVIWGDSDNVIWGDSVLTSSVW